MEDLPKDPKTAELPMHQECSMKALVKILCVFGLTVFCGACGGGSGGGGTTTAATVPPAPPAIPDPVSDANYTVFQLDVLPGHSRAQANDINDNGQIVGFSAAPLQTAVLWTVDATGAITLQSLGMLIGGTFSIAYGINNLGQVVGFADGASGTRRPFIWTANDGMRDLGVPVGLVGGWAYRINDAGQVVGIFTPSQTDTSFESTFGIWIVDESGATTEERNLGNLGGKNAIAFDNNVHGNVAGDIFFELTGSGTNQTGFFWSEAGGVIEIGTEEALGINDFDEVVGVLSTSGDDGYVWTAAGGLTEILGGVASAINNSGQVTGRPNAGGPAWIWENGERKLLPMHENRDFGWGLSINEAGWIVGWSTDVGGNEYANLWIPVQP